MRLSSSIAPVTLRISTRSSGEVAHYRRLPQGARVASSSVRTQAQRAYELFRSDPNHPSLRFKPVHPSRPIYSVRIGIHYRALGCSRRQRLVWFWIGSHDEYERLISQR